MRKSPAIVASLRRCLLVFLCVAPLAVCAQELKLAPVDEAGRDASWVGFRNRLLAAIEKRDRKFLLGILDRDIRNSLEAPRGIAEFRRQWDIEADDSSLWRELSSALFLGAAYVERGKGRRELCAPYVLAKWPQDVDPFVNGVIISREVLVKAEPASGSGTLQTLSYDLVAVADWEVADRAADVKQRWVKVKVRSGEGYVPEEQIRSPVEHSACFVKTESGWRLTGFGPGGGS